MNEKIKYNWTRIIQFWLLVIINIDYNKGIMRKIIL